MAPAAARACTVEAPARRVLEYALATKTLVSRTTSGLTRGLTAKVGAQVEPGADRRREAAPIPVVPRTPLLAQRATARFVADPGRSAAQTGSNRDPPNSGSSDRSCRTHVRPPTLTRLAVSPAEPLVPSAERSRRRRDRRAGTRVGRACVAVESHAMSDPSRFEPAAGITRARLERMVDEATVDCYGEAEEAACLLDALEVHVRLPFSTTILNVAVSVVRFELTDRDDIVALCTRDGAHQTVPLVDLPLPSPLPQGAEWIDAYRLWAGVWAADFQE